MYKRQVYGLTLTLTLLLALTSALGLAVVLSEKFAEPLGPVSYTHLTLPTSDLV